MTYTLYKYIFRELFRVFLLALTALTLILSIGSILQPIQQYGAGPRQVAIFMFYFLPITLTFVLPIAALFAGALVYGRFASDNELDACRASGLSILNLVVPGLFLACVVAISNLFLSFYVMPTFVHLAEKSLKVDIKQMLFRSIEQKGYYKIEINPENTYLLYADYADNQNDTLYGVVLTEIESSQINEVYTTESAKIKIIFNEKSNELQIMPHNIFQFSPTHSVALHSTVFTTRFGSLLSDNIAFKKIDEMRKIKANLLLFDPVAEKARETLTQLTIELLAYDIQNHTAKPNDQENTEYFYEIPGEPNSLKFTVSKCTVLKDQVHLSGEMTFIEYDNKNQANIHTFKTKEAALRIDNNTNNTSLVMDLRNTSEVETGEIKMWHSFTGLNIPNNIQKRLQQFYDAKGSIDLQKLSSKITNIPGFVAGEELIKKQSDLERIILGTKSDLKAEIHSRLVFGLGCISMIMIGIGIGIIKRGGHLLTAFGASCVPAAILIVCIMSGKQLTENLGAQTVSGIMIMWAGLGTLYLIASGIFYYLAKN